MTKAVVEVLAEWMKTFPQMQEDATIDTDRVGEDADEMGLFRAPGDSITNYVDGSRAITSYYIFRIRQAAQEEGFRATSHRWLEDLERWVREQNIIGNLPALTDDRTCTAVKISAAAYMWDEAESESVYQIGIELGYFEKAISI